MVFSRCGTCGRNSAIPAPVPARAAFCGCSRPLATGTSAGTPPGTRCMAPRPVRGLEALLAHPLERGEVVGQHPVERRGLRAPWQVRGRGAGPVGARSMPSDGDHDRCRAKTHAGDAMRMSAATTEWTHRTRQRHRSRCRDRRRGRVIGIWRATPPHRHLPQTGPVVPFRVPSGAHGCPGMPSRSWGNFLPVLAMRCATVASCWRQLRSLNQ